MSRRRAGAALRYHVEREKRGAFAYYSLAEGALERVSGLLGQAVPVTA